MEDFKQKIAALEKWADENKDSRALIIIAVEDNGETTHTSSLYCGKGNNIISGLRSVMQKERQFMDFVSKAAFVNTIESLEKVVGGIINKKEQPANEEEKQ